LIRPNERGDGPRKSKQKERWVMMKAISKAAMHPLYVRVNEDPGLQSIL
jgi:hypothetical protein